MDQIGKYRLISPIGRGGQSTVFKANDEHGQTVALKGLAKDAICSYGLKRFRRQSESMEKLVHPNIVQVLETGETDTHIYLVMEYLDGITLAERLPIRASREIPECLAIMRQLSDSITAIHEQNILHRDIKPSNIMLMPNGDSPKVKLMDFGLARALVHDTVTQYGVVIGSTAYCAPERLMGLPSQPASDVFSLGVVFYEMLTIVKPFPGADPKTVMGNIFNMNPVPPRKLCSHVPKSLSELILEMLTKIPDERISSREVFDALHRFQNN